MTAERPGRILSRPREAVTSPIMNLTHLFDLSLVGRRDESRWSSRAARSPSAKSTRAATAWRTRSSARGLKTGDRLCVYLANCVEMIDLYLACVKLGVIFVPVNILYREREIAHILHDAEPGADRRPTLAELAADACRAAPTSGHAGRARRRHARGHHLHLRHHRRVEGRGPHAQQLRRERDQPARLLADHRGRPLPARAAAVSRPRARQRPALLAGQRLPHAPAGALRPPEGRRRRSSTSARRSSSACPTIYVRLLDIAARARRARSARRCGCSSPARRRCRRRCFEEFRALFGHTILERYGMSETFMNISNPYVGERRPGTVGLPLPGVSVQIVDGEL